VAPNFGNFLGVASEWNGIKIVDTSRGGGLALQHHAEIREWCF
jgi:hypothetical protein